MFAVIALSSALIFYGISLITNLLVEYVVEVTDLRKRWIWKNTFVSFLHAVIVSVWILHCFVKEPNLLSEVVTLSTTSGTYLAAFTSGYSIFDTVDIFLQDKLRQWELLVHHVIVVSSLIFMVTTKQYMGLALIALAVEFSSSLLHFRRLLKIAQRSNSKLYKIVCAANIFGLLIVRMYISCWLLFWITRNYQNIPVSHALFLLAGMIMLFLVTIGIIYRLGLSDFKGQEKDQ